MTDRIEGFHLSVEQKRLWSGNRRGQSAYVIGSMSIPPGVSSKDLQSAITKTCSEYETLRTSFRALPGMSFPLQVVLDEPDVAFKDVSESQVGQQQKEDVAAAESNGWLFDFDLSRGPIVRCERRHTQDDGDFLRIAIPALNIDVFSFKDFVADVANRFSSSSQEDGEPSAQFIDYSEWQRGYLASAEAAEHRDFWQRRHDELWQMPRLPYEKDKAVASSNAVVREQVTGELLDGLIGVASREGIDLGCLLHAVLNVLLWRLTGQDQIVTYRLFDGRTFAEVDGAIGSFCKFVPVRIGITGDEAFTEHLESLSNLVDEVKPA